jgi:hypothetical protein
VLKETLLAEVVNPVVSDIWRASEAGEPCEAYLCHMRLGHQPLPMEGRVRHLLDDGNMHEDDIVQRLKDSGLNILHTGEDQLYVHCVEGPINISGHPDGMIKGVPEELRHLDWTDGGFSWDSPYHLLEITAPNTFAFERYGKEHLRGVNFRKFVQTHLYLGSRELRDKMHCAVVEVKNKMTSALYEEGLTFDQSVVDQTIERLKSVEELVAHGKVSSVRCRDWHKKLCKFRHLCFAEVEGDTVLRTAGFLDADKLLEAQQLREALDAYVQGKEYEQLAEELTLQSRAYFGEIIDQYEAEGIFVDGRKIKWVNSSWSGIDTETLKIKYPTVYEEVHIIKPTHYVGVGRGSK